MAGGFVGRRHPAGDWDARMARWRADLLGQLGGLLGHVLARSRIHGLLRYKEGRMPQPWEMPADALLAA